MSTVRWRGEYAYAAHAWDDEGRCTNEGCTATLATPAPCVGDRRPREVLPEAGLTWEQATACHRLLGVIAGMDRRDPGHYEVARWAVADLVSRADLPAPARALILALHAWVMDPGSDLDTTAAPAVAALYDAWFHGTARPALEGLIRQTAAAPMALCAACVGAIGGAGGGPDLPWRSAQPGEACDAEDCETREGDR